jgi:hypothetical protein
MGFSFAPQPYKQDVAGSKPAPGISTSTAVTLSARIRQNPCKMVGTLHYFT